MGFWSRVGAAYTAAVGAPTSPDPGEDLLLAESRAGYWADPLMPAPQAVASPLDASGPAAGLIHPQLALRKWPQLSSPTVAANLFQRALIIGSLPVEAVRIGPDGKETPADLPPWIRLPYPSEPHLTASGLMRAAEMSFHLGGFFALRLFWRRDTGGLGMVWPIDPDCILPAARSERGMWWTVSSADPILRTSTTLAPHEVLWIPYHTLPGWELGVSLFDLAHDTIRLDRSIRQHAQDFFASASVPCVHYDAGTTTQQLREIRREIEQGQTRANRQKILITKNGATVRALNHDAEGSQMLDSQRYMDVQARKLTRTPAMMSQESDPGAISRASGETQSAGYDRREIETDCKYIQEGLRPIMDGRELRLKIADLTRGDIAARQQRLVANIAGSLYTIDEARREEGLETYDTDLTARTLWRPANTVPVPLQPDTAPAAPAAAQGGVVDRPEQLLDGLVPIPVGGPAGPHLNGHDPDTD